MVTIAASIAIALTWRLYGAWVKCHRAAYRWKWWRVKASWGLLAFDLLACALFFLMASTSGTVVGEGFAPAKEPLVQLLVSGAAATGVRNLRMPAFLKRSRGIPDPALAPAVERETVNQYIERVIQQTCYAESQLWIMETVVPHVLGRRRIDDFLTEVQSYLEGRDGSDAASDAKWIEKLIKSAETETRKVASACGRMLARNGFRYVERVIARLPDAPADPAALEQPETSLPGRHPAGVRKSAVPRPDPDAKQSQATRHGPDGGKRNPREPR